MRPFRKLLEYQDEKGLKMIEHETLIKKRIKSYLRINRYLICIQFEDLLVLKLGSIFSPNFI